MNITRSRIFIVFSIFCALVVGYVVRDFTGNSAFELAQNVGAQNGGSDSRRCSSQTLRGTYGIKFDGLSLERGQIASVSRVTFDGNGQFTTSEIARLNGNLINRTFTGPYTVNADCTGFLDFSSTISNPPHAAHGEIVIVDNGKEFFVLDNEDGWVASGIGKKQ